MFKQTKTQSEEKKMNKKIWKGKKENQRKFIFLSEKKREKSF